jgi:hypothetical protein
MVIRFMKMKWPPEVNKPRVAITTEEIQILVAQMCNMFCAFLCIDLGEEPARNRSTAAVMRFLGHIEELDLKLNPKCKEPIWIAKLNFLGLLKVCESFSDFQHVRNLHEGGFSGEGIVKEVRPLVAKGVHNSWVTNILLSHCQHQTIDMLI